MFPKMSKIDFPGLGTLRLAIWTTYFLFFKICLGIAFQLFDRFLGRFWSIPLLKDRPNMSPYLWIDMDMDGWGGLV